MAISIGDALLKLGVDTKDLDKGMQSLGSRIKQHHKAIGLAFTAAGSAILAAGALSIKTFAQMGDEVQKMALRTGFSTEALSELRHAAEISGASLSTLEKGVKRMSGTILDAQDGLETYIRAFQHIGIQIKELDGLNPEEQFLRIAEAIAEVEDPTKRAAIAQDIFGRAGTELLPLFAAGKEGLADLRKEAHELGIVFDQEAANKAAEFNDAMTRMNESVSGVKMAIAEQLIPILLPLIDKIKETVSGISAWIKEHPKLTESIVKFTAVLAGLMVVGGPMLIFAPTLGKILIASKALVAFITTRLIPTLIALISVLWAKVTALFAVLVAMGPVGWGLAAAGMATLTAGLILLQRHHTKQLEALAGATKEVTEATQAQAEQQRIVIDQSEEEAKALEVVTEEVDKQADAFQRLRAQINSAFAAATQKIAAPVREPFASAEQRARWQAEATMWEERARIAGAAGDVEQAAFAAQQAAAMQTRLQAFPHGGIAMRPMLASIAERQPEAVIPLDRLEGMIGGKRVNIFVELDGRRIAQAIGQPLVEEIRLRTGARI